MAWMIISIKVEERRRNFSLSGVIDREIEFAYAHNWRAVQRRFVPPYKTDHRERARIRITTNRAPINVHFRRPTSGPIPVGVSVDMLASAAPLSRQIEWGQISSKAEATPVTTSC